MDVFFHDRLRTLEAAIAELSVGHMIVDRASHLRPARTVKLPLPGQYPRDTTEQNAGNYPIGPRLQEADPFLWLLRRCRRGDSTGRANDPQPEKNHGG